VQSLEGFCILGCTLLVGTNRSGKAKTPRLWDRWEAAATVAKIAPNIERLSVSAAPRESNL
jgi:hypothetical protein